MESMNLTPLVGCCRLRSGSRQFSKRGDLPPAPEKVAGPAAIVVSRLRYGTPLVFKHSYSVLSGFAGPVPAVRIENIAALSAGRGGHGGTAFFVLLAVRPLGDHGGLLVGKLCDIASITES